MRRMYKQGRLSWHSRKNELLPSVLSVCFLIGYLALVESGVGEWSGEWLRKSGRKLKGNFSMGLYRNENVLNLSSAHEILNK